MPSIVTRYVDTRSPAGGDGTTPSTGSDDPARAYNNLSVALTATSASFSDLVSADMILKIECAGGLDNSALTYSPTFIADYDRYLWITANSESRHTGVWDLSKYTIGSTGNSTRIIAIDNIKVLKLEGLQIENRSTNGVWSIISNVNATTQDRELQVIDCHLRSVSSSANPGNAINFPYILRKNVVIVNTIIHGRFTFGVTNSFTSSGSRPSVLYNTTIFGPNTGSAWGSGNAVTTHSIYNNIVVPISGGVAFSTSSGNYTITGNNISSDESSPQIELRNITMGFVDTASGNFNLTDRSSPAVNTGADLSTDILYPFTTDVAGNIRGTLRGGKVWDVGALEYQRPTSVMQTIGGSIVSGSNLNSGVRIIGSTTWG